MAKRVLTLATRRMDLPPTEIEKTGILQEVGGNNQHSVSITLRFRHANFMDM